MKKFQIMEKLERTCAKYNTDFIKLSKINIKDLFEPKIRLLLLSDDKRNCELGFQILKGLSGLTWNELKTICEANRHFLYNRNKNKDLWLATIYFFIGVLPKMEVNLNE